MPQRHQTAFVTGCNAADLIRLPGASVASYSSERWKQFEAILAQLEARAGIAQNTLAAAAANGGGPLISYANLVPINEAASDLGFIHDQLEAAVSHLANESMAAWQKLVVELQAKVAPLLAAAKQNGHILSTNNPTFDFAQLR